MKKIHKNRWFGVTLSHPNDFLTRTAVLSDVNIVKKWWWWVVIVTVSPMWVTDLGTRQSARCRVVASSSNREAMSFPWGTETKVKAIFSAAWCFLLENTISVSFCSAHTYTMTHTYTKTLEISVSSLKAYMAQTVESFINTQWILYCPNNLNQPILMSTWRRYELQLIITLLIIDWF